MSGERYPVATGRAPSSVKAARFLARRDGGRLRFVKRFDGILVEWADIPAEACAYEASQGLEELARLFKFIVLDINQALDACSGDLNGNR